MYLYYNRFQHVVSRHTMQPARTNPVFGGRAVVFMTQLAFLVDYSSYESGRKPNLTSSNIRVRNIMENFSGQAYLVYLLHPWRLTSCYIQSNWHKWSKIYGDFPTDFTEMQG